MDLGVPLITELPLARAIIELQRWRKPEDLEVTAWNDFVTHHDGAEVGRAA